MSCLSHYELLLIIYAYSVTTSIGYQCMLLLSDREFSSFLAALLDANQLKSC
jgi:hypothetical protein